MAIPDRYQQVWSEYVDWLLLTPYERTVHGLPDTDRAFAEEKGVSDRTLRRWKQDSDTESELDRRRASKVAHLVPGSATAPRSVREELGLVARPGQVVAPVTDDDDPAYIPQASEAEQQYAQMRQLLYELAKQGDKTAVAEWFKWYGKPFVEAEAAQLNSPFADLSDEELARRTLELMPPSVLEGVTGA